jgi:ADP-ribosyl-[dinitrogen reductase] hydrolase
MINSTPHCATYIDVNAGKKKYWVRGGNYHYHLGLEAGENTLEAQLCRVLMRSILTCSREGSLAETAAASSTATASTPVFSVTHFREQYMHFLQTPGSHNDTYASTAHRMFFANLVQGK